MASHFSVREARLEDIAEIMSLVLPCFEHIPVEQALGNVNTPAGQKATDPETGKDTIVGFAEWFIYDKEQTPEQYRKPPFLVSASWIADECEREKAKRWMQPVIDARIKWLGGKRHAILMYMCVDKAWRRNGASTMCVQWGLDRCKELDLPAYLEASEDGEPVYQRLGFEEMEKVAMDFDGVQGVFPAMMWWPPGTKQQDKVPARP